MESITLKRLLPRVFRSSQVGSSGVWLQESVQFSRGCRVCVNAESGAGKSSLLNFVYGARTDYDGSIFFDSKSARSLSRAEWCDVRRRSLAYLPQEMRLFPELTVMENIHIKNRLTSHKSEQQILEMLDLLQVAHKADILAGKLSVGQQQRVAIVRALCQPFDFLLLDEPVSHLDRQNNLTAAQLVEREAAACGAGIITTSVGNPLLLKSPSIVVL